MRLCHCELPSDGGWLQGRQVSDSIREAFEHFTQRAATGFIVPEWLPTPDNMRYNGAVHRLDTFIYSLINSRKAELAGQSQAANGAQQGGVPDDVYESVTPECLLDALLLSRDEEGRGMEEQALRDELMTLLVAGQETSAILLGWVCASLAWNPGTQAAAAAEVQVCFPRHCCTPALGCARVFFAIRVRCTGHLVVVL